MSNSIDAAIQAIDQEIARLQQARQLLTGGNHTPEAKPRQVGGKTRKETIADFIRTHGPSTRAELIRGTQIPTGTISFVLNDPEFKSVNGKWQMAKSRR